MTETVNLRTKQQNPKPAEKSQQPDALLGRWYTPAELATPPLTPAERAAYAAATRLRWPPSIATVEQARERLRATEPALDAGGDCA